MSGLMILYRILISLLTPVMAVKLLMRIFGRGEGRERLRDFAERMGLGGGAAATGARAHLWLHAASNGELMSARPLVERLAAQRPDMPLLITCNTVSGRALAREWGYHAQLAPLDLRWMQLALARRWKIAALVSLEAELWPNRFALMAQRGAVVLVGARLSEGTARAVGRVPGLPGALSDAITWLSAQDSASRTRFLALGVPSKRVGESFNLKALYQPPETSPSPELQAQFPRAETLLAASTHEGEEAVVVEAYCARLREEPGLRLILAPRHPKRADALAALLTARAIPFARRTNNAAQNATPPRVLLADTLGEMALWYRLAGRVFIGGSLVDRGGHTPFEPAHFGCALIHGTHLSNFAAPYRALASEGAALQVHDAASLCAALGTLAPAQAQRAAGAKAQAVLGVSEGQQRGFEALFSALEAHLPTPSA